MSGTYKAIGINLKSAPLGETDRLLTILTQEAGLIRVVAPGSRKYKSTLGGRSSLFVVNQLLIARGKTLDKIVQAESLESYPGLSQDLSKLTAGQYLAELALCQALSDQPQVELFSLLQEHLSRLEQLPRQLPKTVTLAYLTHAVFHLLALAGLTPQLQACCVTQQPIAPDFNDPDWRVGFSAVAGGTVSLDELERLMMQSAPRAASPQGSYRAVVASRSASQRPDLHMRLNAAELNVLRQLAQADLSAEFTHPDQVATADQRVWLSAERVLRHYAQYHFDRPIRSAALIDVCFTSADTSSLSL